MFPDRFLIVKNITEPQADMEPSIEWINENLKKLEAYYWNFETVSFKICRVKEKGFLVKVLGIFGYVSFDFMPWKYPSHEIWKSFSETLIGKVFYAKIHLITKEMNSYMLNASIPQFKRPIIEVDEKYKGIILHSNNKRVVLVDIGIHFEWKKGSFIGIVIDVYGDILNPNRYKIGDEVEVFYTGVNEHNVNVFTLPAPQQRVREVVKPIKKVVTMQKPKKQVVDFDPVKLERQPLQPPIERKKSKKEVLHDLQNIKSELSIFNKLDEKMQNKIEWWIQTYLD